MKKKSKALIVGSVFFGIALILSIAVIATGGLTKDYWINIESKMRVAQGFYADPVQISTTIDESAITKLDINEDQYGINIEYSDTVQDISITYFEDFEGQAVVTADSGTLKLSRKFKFRLFSFNFGRSECKTILTLPTGFAFTESSIKISGGNSKLTGVTLGNLTALNVAGGTLTMDKCSATYSGKINVNGGDLIIKDANASGNFDVNLSGGDINISGSASLLAFDLRVSGGEFVCSDQNFTSGNINVSGGNVTIKNATFTLPVTAKVSGSVLGIIDSTIADKLTGNVSGGKLKLKNVTGISEYKLSVSGGSIDVDDLNVSTSEITLNYKADGGRVYLNGERVKGLSPTVITKVLFNIQLSGGRVNINTI